MTKDEALKMAIDWIEGWSGYSPSKDEALKACKEALAQPSMTYEQGFAHGYEAHKAEQSAQEPVAYTDKYRNFLEWYIKDLCDKAVCKKHEAIPLYTSPQKQWVGLSNEPFGYFKAEPFGWTDCAETDEGAVALYENPPASTVETQRQWVSLSDDDFKDTSWFTDEFIEGANWAQNKLKELNT